VIDDRVYFAAGKTLYSLNAKDGSLRWKRVICGNPEGANCSFDPADPTRIFSSPAVFQGLIFVGHTVETVEGNSVGYRGGFEAINAATGELRWHFEVDPFRPYNRGCGSVWTSAAVDVATHLVFFGTADCHNEATPPYHEAVIALQGETGTVRWVYRPRQSDPHLCNLDFGASPNVIDFAGGHYLGEGGKDGTYYLLNRRTGELVWARNVVFGGSAGGFFGAAFDGTHIFAATSLGDGDVYTQTGLCDPSNPRDTFLQEPSMHALNVANGSILWERTQNHSVAPTSLANGVVFSGLVGIEGFGLKAYDARTGEQLMRIPIPGSVNSRGYAPWRYAVRHGRKFHRRQGQRRVCVHPSLRARAPRPVSSLLFYNLLNTGRRLPQSH
jgi:outer membrane protein assembly factor BamB